MASLVRCRPAGAPSEPTGPHSSRGPGHRPLKAEITGSNPVCGTRLAMLASPIQPDRASSSAADAVSGGTDMSKVRAHIATSVDGYAAGPNQTQEEPLGEGGEGLHDWLVRLKAWRERAGLDGGEEDASTRVVDEVNTNVGAEIMGRGKFGPAARGPWGSDPWKGWWGDDPPFHKPVFVLTHHERTPLTLSDTTFTFVTDGIESALQQARAAADGKDVYIGGGADVINRYLAAGLVDEIEVHVSPLLLGGGARLFDGVGPDLKLEQLRAVEAPGVAHLKYRVVK